MPIVRLETALFLFQKVIHLYSATFNLLKSLTNNDVNISRGGEVRLDPVVGTQVDSYITRSVPHIKFLSNDPDIFDGKIEFIEERPNKHCSC